ncbi:molybdopterin-guanine dinucleotide biosynthesis protein MobA [Desulfosporosinus sp. HMP52]|uniref:nucleotidyltransferase family protein n=1 Tax=Desulfosporosinus sp. HMP52 TaxID=1487923 RepID=UPI00051FBCCE|nr:nucleotidyltransferase family protein [Desulfosporosinus sp. HMP52]KGK91459.1 molybdopterin-guanine dinucleotide biosynthesis protein MobA [Desulfosporosinus sp. HMP52]
MVRFVVMAAGLASRMGKDKLALPWKNTTVLGHVLDTVLSVVKNQPSALASEMEIRVVARQPIEKYVSEDRIGEFYEHNGVWLFDPNPRPLAETIRIGLQDLNSEVHSYAFLQGDQVGVTAQMLSACLAEVINHTPDFLVPMTGETAGSPVFFHKRYIPELSALQGEQGGRMVLNLYPDRWRKFPVEEGCLDDVDTPEQYQALFSQHNVY